MIQITPFIALDEGAIAEDFVRASGPGGQNVNKVATAVQMRLAIGASGLPKDVQERLRAIGGRRVTQQGDLLITAQRHRTRERNRQAALNALVRLVERAVELPVPRIATRPTPASQRRRLQTKAHRARLKERRNTPVSEA
jgi:ribosome-associated protein